MEKQQKPILKCLVGLDWGSKPQCATLTIISPMRFHENESQGQVTPVFTMINRLYMVTETDLIAKTLHFLMPTSEKTIYLSTFKASKTKINHLIFWSKVKVSDLILMYDTQPCSNQNIKLTSLCSFFIMLHA
jgi:hypothetical protein